jgi:hypothetical protein
VIVLALEKHSHNISSSDGRDWMICSHCHCVSLEVAGATICVECLERIDEPKMNIQNDFRGSAEDWMILRCGGPPLEDDEEEGEDVEGDDEDEEDFYEISDDDLEDED